MRLIDADALIKRAAMRGHCLRPLVTAYHMCVDVKDIEKAPTIDAVPVDVVAQIFFDFVGDVCPCNYNDINEWLAGSDGCTEECDNNDDPLHCWKMFIKYYRERRSENV